MFSRLIEPFCSGVYAGDPTKLSMKAAFGKVYDLELKGGSIIGGVLKLMQDKKANPPPPRDARLPPKPPGQTVGSFRAGLQTLPEAIAAGMPGAIRCNWSLCEITKAADGTFRCGGGREGQGGGHGCQAGGVAARPGAPAPGGL